MPAPANIVAAFRQQAGWCRRLDSPFSAQVLDLLAGDLEAGGTLAGSIGAWAGDPVADALSLRVLGALHALVLTDADQDLKAVYPPHDAGPAALAAAVPAALEHHRNTVQAFLGSAPQTNEIGRSAVLLGGFLTVAAETGKPLRLLEIGASAGLNLIWDLYRIRLGDGFWGDADSPVLLAPHWQGALPPLDAPLSVASRTACDLAPVDLDDDAARLRLRAFVWPEQTDRLERLDRAIALFRRSGHTVARADAAAWVADRLGMATPGTATVLYHSIMWHYLPEATQQAIAATVRAAGSRASAGAPLAWLRFEFDALDAPPVLRLTLWPGGEARLLARAHPHGAEVHWLAGS